jgi:hypothetical protein
VDPLGAFNATWTAAKSSFGDGAPQGGEPYRNGSAVAGQAGTTLESAQPTAWTGNAADSYRSANVKQRQHVAKFAAIDSQVGARIDRSAAVVMAGRRKLESVRDEVNRLASQIPPGSFNREQLLLPIAMKGIGDVETIIQKSQGDLDSIGDELDRLAAEYETLCGETQPETDEERKKRQDEESRKKLDDILKNYQVADEDAAIKVSDWLPRWALACLPKSVRDMELRKSEALLLAELGPLDAVDAFRIKDHAEKMCALRFPPPDGITGDNHTDAFRHAYWNAMMTQRFGEEWTRKFTTAHERKPGYPAAQEAMDLHNNEIGRRIALDNPSASPDELALIVENAVKNGDTVVVRPDGAGLEWSNNIPLDDENIPRDTRCGIPSTTSSPPITDHTPYPTEGRTP